MSPAQHADTPRVTLMTCMLLIAALGLLLAATRYWGRGRWMFLLLILGMGVLHRIVLTGLMRR